MKVLIHPEIAAVLRTLTVEEYAGLRIKLLMEKCRESFPYFMLDGKAYQLDGHHRRKICKEEGLPFDWYEVKLPSLAEAIKWVKKNQQARRNLSQEELQKLREERIERVVEARNEGKSLRTIAEEEGKSERTIRNDLAAATAEGSAVEPPNGKVTGKDGKERPAVMPKPDTILCDRCKRVGATPDCYACEVTRRETVNPSPREPRQPNPLKNGEETFSMREVTEYCGKLRNQLNRLARDYGLIDRTGAIKITPPHAGLERLIDEVKGGTEAWRSQLQKGART